MNASQWAISSAEMFVLLASSLGSRTRLRAALSQEMTHLKIRLLNTVRDPLGEPLVIVAIAPP